ncbi:MAG: hypothetical protein WC782_06670 [Methylococcaceae bacterium]
MKSEILLTRKGGEPVQITPENPVVFPEGLNSRRQVVKPLRNHNSYD